MKIVFTTYGVQDIWLDYKKVFDLDGKQNNGARDIQHHKSFWKNWIRKKILAFEEKKWLAEINDIKMYPKLRTYCLFKSRLRLEDYLLVASNAVGRRIHTSLRSGTNKLAIELDRWKKIPKEERFCQQCDTKEVETELHFLVECPRFETLRLELFKNILNSSGGKWDLLTKSFMDRFLLLINGTQDTCQAKIFTLLHTYLKNCFKIRKDTVDMEDFN